MGNCTKCGKKFNFISISCDSETVYKGLNYELSLNEKYPDNSYRGKKLCEKCYREIYENPQATILKKPANDKSLVTNENSIGDGSALRAIVCIVFVVAFLVSVVGIVALPLAVWNFIGLGQGLVIGFALLVGFCVVVLSYWVYDDGSKLETLYETVRLLRQEVNELNSKRQDSELKKSTNS
jgi:hypothetical protein